MKNIICLTLLIASLFSCQNDGENIITESSNIKAKLKFVCGKPSFSNTGIISRTTIENGWKNNDEVFITFNNGIHSYALYDQSSGWTIWLFGIPNASGTATCRYFENGNTNDFQNVSLNSSSIEYCAQNIEYTYADKNVNFTTPPVTLNPNCARLRFYGVSGKSVTASGLLIPYSFYILDDSAEKSPTTKVVNLTIGTDGYTEYIYCYPSATNTLSYTYDGKSGTKTFSSADLPIGTSGYIDLTEAVTVIHMEDVGRNEFNESGSLDQSAYTLEVSPTSLSTAATGSTNIIDVTSNDFWTVSKSDSWITLSKTSGSNDGSITVTSSANTSTTSRIGKVTVTGTNSGIIRAITVSQAGASYTLSATPASVSMGSVQSTQTITITSNDSWTVSNSASWITLSKTSGSNNGTFTITASDNTGSERSTTMIVKGANSGISVPITVTQAKASDIGRDDYPDDGSLDQNESSIEKNGYGNDTNLD